MIPLIESFGISDIGLSRINNEDVWKELSEDYFYVLADGMGGHLAGDVAAKESVLQLCDSMERFFRQHPSPGIEATKQHLKKAFQETNQWIRNLAAKHVDFSGMGTTLCCFLVLQDTLIYGHIGDSRIYRFRNHLERLTTDHSLKEELLLKGRLNEATASHFPQKNILTRALGISAVIHPDISHTATKPNDIYFLCSDGLHDPLSEREMEGIIRQSAHIKEASIRLIEAAKNAGGSDNITILMIKI